MKIQQKKIGGGVWGGRGGGGGVWVDMNEECGCERRSFVKIKKRNFFAGGSGRGGGRVGGGQGRCERRSEIFVKI